MPLIKINPRFPVTGRISFTPPCGDTSILRGCQAHLPPAARSGARSLDCPLSPGLPGTAPLPSGWLCVHPEVPGTPEVKFSSGGSGRLLQGSPSSTPRQTSQGISQVATAGHRPFLQVTWGCLCRLKSLVRNPASCSRGHASVEPVDSGFHVDAIQGQTGLGNSHKRARAISFHGSHVAKPVSFSE